MRNQHKLIHLMILLAFCAYSKASQPTLSASPISKLIDQPVVASIYRDRNGFLWIGTQEGLYKFDGANVTVFNSDDNNENWIASSDIRGIAEDDTGSLIVASYGAGLLKWDQIENRFMQYRDYHNNSDTQLIQLHMSSTGNIWLVSENRITSYRRAPEVQRESESSRDFGTTLGVLYTVLEDNSGNLWIGSSRGLFKLSSLSGKPEKYDISSLAKETHLGVTALGLDARDRLLIGTNKGHLAFLDDKRIGLATRTALDNTESSLVSSFSFRNDSIIVATDDGLYSVDLDLSRITDITDSNPNIPSRDIYSIYDDGNYIWVGTYSGLYLLSFSPIELFDTGTGVGQDVLAFGQDNTGHLWIGTYNGLYIYDHHTQKHRRVDDIYNLTDQRVTSLAITKYHVWIGLYQGGIQAISIESGKNDISTLPTNVDFSVMDILPHSDNESVWVATFSRGLIKITPEELRYYYDDNSLPEKGVSLLLETNHGMVVVATSNKIYRYLAATDEFELLDIDFGPETDHPVIFSMTREEDGSIWIGTKDRGLFRWRKADQNHSAFSVEHVSKSTTLEFSTIYGIQIDSDGQLWCATQNGIVYLDANGILIRRFLVADGLQGNDFNFGASFTSKEGLIYFGGVNGYNRFDPMEIEIDESPSPMKLTGISLPGAVETSANTLGNITSLELTHKDRFLTFQFSVLDFVHPEKNQFRYTLENFDPDWIEKGTRNTATYTSLPPGDYTFRAQGANSAGIWNREGISVDVRVLPPPWLTWWAFCIYATFIACCAWVFHRIYRSYAIERRSIELATEMLEAENQAEDDMLEQLEFQDELVESAYEHNRTTLALIEGCLKHKGKKDLAGNSQILARSTSNRITALKYLEDSFIYEPEGPLADLNAYTDRIIPLLLEESPVSVESIVTVNQVATIPIPAPIASPLSIVILELIENCVLHAFDPQSPANFIQIELTAGYMEQPVSRCLNLTVSDSGSGVTQALDELIEHNSGIALIQTLIDALDGELNYESDAGTTVSVTIPLPTQP